MNSLLTVIIEFQEAAARITEKLATWAMELIEMIPNMAVAVLVILIFFVIARLLRMGIRKINRSAVADRGIMHLISNFVFFIVIGLGIFMALSVLQLDKTVTSLLAGAGIIGLALGFAFQETAANFLSGVLMTIRKPITLGDLIESNGITGYVKELNLRATVLENTEGQDIIIPNKSVFYSSIKNYTVNGRRRIDIEVGVSYGEDLFRVRDITLDCIKNVEGIMTDKKIQLFYTKFDNSSINFVLRIWTADTAQINYFKMRSDVIMAIKAAYDANDITIPFPIRTLDFGIKGGTKLNEVLKDSKNDSGQRNQDTEV
jgi:small-conductance mechanosensitive channel